MVKHLYLNHLRAKPFSLNPVLANQSSRKGVMGRARDIKRACAIHAHARIFYYEIFKKNFG